MKLLHYYLPTYLCNLYNLYAVGSHRDMILLFLSTADAAATIAGLLLQQMTFSRGVDRIYFSQLGQKDQSQKGAGPHIRPPSLASLALLRVIESIYSAQHDKHTRSTLTTVK